MINYTHKTIISTLLFSTIAFTHTGCVQKYFFDDEPEVIYYEAPTSYEAKPTVSQINQIEVECSDEVSPEQSNCDRGAIATDELTGKNTQHTTSGVIHSLQSVQGHSIQVVERPTGFLFPNYRGKVIIFVMFGKDCPHCTKEIPVLKQLKQHYPGQVEVIAIQSQERMAPYIAKSYINQHRINYPIIEGDDATDLQYFIQNTYGWTGILPFAMVVKDGITQMTYPGAVSFDEIRADMDTLF